VVFKNILSPEIQWIKVLKSRGILASKHLQVSKHGLLLIYSECNTPQAI